MRDISKDVIVSVLNKYNINAIQEVLESLA